MNDKDKKNKQDGNSWDWINQILWSPYNYFKGLFGLEDKDNQDAEPTTRNSSSEVKKDNSVVAKEKPIKEKPIKEKPIQEEEFETTWPMTKAAKKRIAEKKQRLASKRKKPVKKTASAPVKATKNTKNKKEIKKTKI